LETSIEISQIVSDFAAAIRSIDARKPVGKTQRFKPGVGPLTEFELTDLVVAELRCRGDHYISCGSRGYPGSRNNCDIVIPHLWAIEIKLARPFGDNGKPAERWSENLLYPYPGNTSSVGDCLKLLESGFQERKGILVIGYEHVPVLIPLEPAVRGFELIVEEIAHISLGERYTETVDGLVHPFHQRAYVYG